MLFDRLTVFEDIGLILACLAVGAVVMAGLTFLLLRTFKIDHRQLGWFAVFLREGKTEQFFLVALICRLFVSFALLFDDNFMALPLLCYGGLCVVLWAICRNLKYIAFDLLYSAEVAAGFYFLIMLREEAGRAKTQAGMKWLLFLAVVFFAAIMAGQFLCGIPEFFAGGMHQKTEQSPTAEDEKVKQRSRFLLVLPLIFVIFPLIMMTQVTTVKTDVPVYQIVNGKTVRYEEGGKVRQGDDTCFLVQGKETIELGKTPLFYEQEETVLFTSVCSVVQPALLLSNRVRAMSVLRKDAGGYVMDYDGDSVKIEDFFLFDGKDTYYFPAGTELQWDGGSYVTAAVCQVTAKYNQYIAIFDTAVGEYQEIPAESGYCMAVLADRTSVNLSTDIMYRENGQEQMLFMQPSLLSDLE